MKTKNFDYDDFIIQLLEDAENFKIEGEFEKAVQVSEKIILECPECFEAFEELGDNYMSLRKLTKAKKAVLHAIKLKPDSANAHYLLGFLFSLEQKWKDSISALTLADEIFPNHPEILRCLGWALYNENRKTQGIAVLERSKNLSPDDVNILCDLGVCYMNSAKFSQAENIFKQVLRIDPNSEQARESMEFLTIIKNSQTKFTLQKKNGTKK